jgi:hypothetical protein
MNDLFGQIVGALSSGLPLLLGHALIALALLGIGAWITSAPSSRKAIAPPASPWAAR